jgi:hypothetical protein
MAWGTISLGARTELLIIDRGTLNADRYITNYFTGSCGIFCSTYCG